MFGWKPDPAGHFYTRFLARFGAGLVNPRDLRPDACKVLDQGESSSCTGHGTATGLFTSAAVAGHPIGFIPSPCDIYTMAVALDRGDPLAGDLRDEGAMPNQVARGLSEFGIRPMDPQSALTDCHPSNGILAEPTLAHLETDAHHVYVGWYDVQNADEARAAIAAGAPVGIGTYVDSKFMDWTPSMGTLGRMNENDPQGGGHWTCLLGFDSKRFYLRNSWGTGWGSDGDCYVNDDFVNQASDLIAFGYRRIG